MDDQLGVRAPRLGEGTRFYGVPARYFYAFVVALVLVAVALVVAAAVTHQGISRAVGVPQVWAFGAAATAVCLLVAWGRINGLRLDQWASAWLAYAITPKRTVYRPNSDSPLAHVR